MSMYAQLKVFNRNYMKLIKFVIDCLDLYDVVIGWMNGVE